MPDFHSRLLRQTLNTEILELAGPAKDLLSRKPPSPNLKKLQPSPLSPSGFSMQPAIPNLIWNWPTAGSGEISQDQFEFCDHMPKSTDPDAAFRPSANSFSQNYSGFLELISPDFVPQSLLASAKAAAAKPTVSPGSGPAPDGWVMVKTTAGVNRWQPNWITDMTPNEFLAQAQSGANRSTLSLTDQSALKAAVRDGLDLICFGEDPDNLSSPQLSPGDIQDIEITAGAWGRVSIFPGDWYNSSLMTLARNGPFIGNYKPETIFGPAGLLPARVGEMVVAANLTARVTFSKQFIKRHQQSFLGARHLEVLGINLTTQKTPANQTPFQVSDQGNTAVVNISSNTTAPSIIGVIIETFNPTQP